MAGETTKNSRNRREEMGIVRDAPKCANTEMTLEFSDTDLEGLKFPHNNPLVITPIIGNYHVNRVMVDNGASVDILFHDKFLKIGYNDSQITPWNAPIYLFNGVEWKVEGAIQLFMTIGEEPREATQMLNFQIVNAASIYNILLGRTGIRQYGA
ncbi:uncharacterized protein LOC141668261 [Apium graveolens]|uniref:uncharacterized protein LOC141668261 n=1 Tax=Apium graveolens TaxID=4045 RepID=UPI003D7C0A08